MAKGSKTKKASENPKKPQGEKPCELECSILQAFMDLPEDLQAEMRGARIVGAEEIDIQGKKPKETVKKPAAKNPSSKKPSKKKGGKK